MHNRPHGLFLAMGLLAIGFLSQTAQGKNSGKSGKGLFDLSIGFGGSDSYYDEFYPEDEPPPPPPPPEEEYFPYEDEPPPPSDEESFAYEEPPPPPPPPEDSFAYEEEPPPPSEEDSFRYEDSTETYSFEAGPGDDEPAVGPPDEIVEDVVYYYYYPGGRGGGGGYLDYYDAYEKIDYQDRPPEEREYLDYYDEFVTELQSKCKRREKPKVCPPGTIPMKKAKKY